MKRCGKCGFLKLKTNFYKDRSHKDGLCSYCKSCQYFHVKLWQEQNKEKVRDYGRIWREENKEKCREDSRKRAKKYYRRHIEKCKERSRKWIKENPEKVRKRSRKYHKAYQKYKEYRECKKQYAKNYYKKNKEKYKEFARKYQAKKRKTNPKYRLDGNMSTAIWRALKENKAGYHWETLVDYTLQDLIKHLENQFSKEMNWNNYGSYWSVDHIKPKSLFNYKIADDHEFKTCWCLQNLQPMEKIANIKKYNHYKESYGEICDV